MKVTFTRTPPQEYSAFIEGETADLPEQEARFLIGLGVAAQPRGQSGDTVMVSDRTEIVGANNETQVVVKGRGANIVSVTSPENDKAPETGTGILNSGVTTEQRLGADREHAEALVKQEAGRTGGFNDETVPDARLAKAKKADKDDGEDAKKAAAKTAENKAQKPAETK